MGSTEDRLESLEHKVDKSVEESALLRGELKEWRLGHERFTAAINRKLDKHLEDHAKSDKDALLEARQEVKDATRGASETGWTWAKLLVALMGALGGFLGGLAAAVKLLAAGRG